MNLKKITEIENLKGKKVLLRVDFNVSLNNGEIKDNTRIKKSLKTIEFLIKKGAKIGIISHLGRPLGEKNLDFSLKRVAKRLGLFLGKEVFFFKDCIGEDRNKEIEKLENGDVLVLENTRFYKEDEENEENFSKKLAENFDIFISDAFGACHRKHSSTYGVSFFLNSFSGFLIEKEVFNLRKVLKNPKNPFLSIIGGSKISTKIKVIENLLKKSNFIILGGAIANTLLKAQGKDIGDSLYEKNDLETARNILKKGGDKILLPKDFIVSKEFSEKGKTRNIGEGEILKDEKILDIGEKTIKFYGEIIEKCKMIIWNGPVGVFEIENFEKGTKSLFNFLKNCKGESIIGGGDTISAMNKFGFGEKDFSYISTGGGASLQFLEGKILPGLEILQKK